MAKSNADFSVVIEMLGTISEDRTVPKNIRTSVDDAKAVLEGDGAVELKVSTAISSLDDIINDPNMPMYTRTQIWNIVSMLEQMRKSI